MVRKLPPEARIEILNLRARGFTYKEIADKTGASQGYIASAIRESPTGEESDHTLMRRLRREGLSNPEIIREPAVAETTRRLELSPSDLVKMLVF